jgi:hypothetical protein
VNASGTPTGKAVPSASRSRPASSTAAQWPDPADPDGPAGPGQFLRPARLGAPLGQLRVGERTEQPQHVGDAFDVLDAAVLGQPLQLPFQLGQHLGVQQLAQLRLAQQFGQQPRVQGQGGGAALGER